MGGGEMGIGDKLVSANGCFEFIFEEDGDMVKRINISSFNLQLVLKMLAVLKILLGRFMLGQLMVCKNHIYSRGFYCNLLHLCFSLLYNRLSTEPMMVNSYGIPELRGLVTRPRWKLTEDL